jgi:hypothetical protein
MLYLIRTPRLNERRLTKEDCHLFGVEWVENETNYELIVMSAEPDNLQEMIEDTLGVVSAKRLKGNVWEVKGFDEMNPNMKLKFNEHGIVNVIVEEMSYEAAEEFFQKPIIASRLAQFCF